MKKLRLSMVMVALLAVGILAGCSQTATKSPDVSDSIRKSLDQAGFKDVTVSQDRDKGIVTLGGQVASENDKSQAESLAKSLAGATFGVAVQPSKNWHINGSVELLYADNVLTPVAPRQLQHYRFHATYRPRTWATFSGAYNDLERHNNTNNTGTASVDGPLRHVDHSRILSLNADLMPNEHYGFDIGYAYSDVYTATNICFLGTASSSTIPGAATPTGAACPSPPPRGRTGPYTFGPAKDFMNAPTQYLSVALALSPIEKFHANVGYRISSVKGSRFFNDPRDVNGSLVSTYLSPFVNLSYAIAKDLILKGEYNYFGYGEGGPSGAQYCNPSSTLPLPTTPAPVVPCNTLANTAMSGPAYGFTAPRNFHANNVTVGVHYEF